MSAIMKPSRSRLFVMYLTLFTSWPGKAISFEIASVSPVEGVVNPEQHHDLLSVAVNDLGLKITLEMIKENQNNNVVVSPAGISGLLAMTLLGSVGKTYDELADTLGFSQDISTNRRHHEQLGDLLKALNADAACSTLYADTIIADADIKLRQDYRNYLNRVYLGDAMTADFTNVDNAKNLVNDWVKNRTLGKIEEFLKEPLPSHTKVVLLSALYFAGQWARPFVPEHTRKMAFSTGSGEVMVDMMLNYGDFDYSFSVQDGVHILALPYKDNTTTMYLIKPHFPKKQNITESLQRLNYTRIDALIKEMRRTECVVRLPKMQLKSRTNLRKSLQELGVKSVFDPVEANFALMVDGNIANTAVNSTEVELISRINSGLDTNGWRDIIKSLPNPGVHVDSVLHDVKINIDEYGTEAVAATSGILARTAQLFYVDSPFYMFIRNERTKLVTFSAVIYDPTV